VGILKEKGKVFILDYDKKILQLLKIRLTLLGYSVIIANTGRNALKVFYSENPDLVITELILPIIDGYEVCRKIRQKSQVPIIILSASGNPSLVLDLGADDYITKPFLPKYLEARIRSLLSRSKPAILKTKNQKKIKINKLSIDLDTRIVINNKRKTKLTNNESLLLEFLFDHEGKNLSRSTIINNVWGYIPEREVDNRIVDLYISKLRSKIEEDPLKPDLILTIRNIGYKFKRN
jgi:OmpR family response regulator RpaB